MQHLNRNWEIFRLATEGTLAVGTVIAASAWSHAVATPIRGYEAMGSEPLFALAAGMAAGILAHVIFNKVEDHINERITKETAGTERRKNNFRMFSVGESKPVRGRNVRMFKVGEPDPAEGNPETGLYLPELGQGLRAQ